MPRFITSATTQARPRGELPSPDARETVESIPACAMRSGFPASRRLGEEDAAERPARTDCLTGKP